MHIKASELFLKSTFSAEDFKVLSVLLSFHWLKENNDFGCLEKTSLEFQFCLNFFNASVEICEAESKLLFPSESAKIQAEIARSNWRNFVIQSAIYLSSVYSNQLPDESSLRLLAALCSTQNEWFENIEFAKIPSADRASAMLESPLFSLNHLAK